MAFHIIPCSGAKLDRAAPARELYVGSMFKMSLAAALAGAEPGDEVLILSALHGLVGIDEIVEPYECRIDSPEAIGVAALAAQAEARGIDWLSDVWAYLPKAYFERLDDALRSLDCYAQFCFEASDRGIGEQRRVCSLAIKSGSQIPLELA